MQLVKEEIRALINPPMPKILCASVAYSNTFVVVRMDKPCQQESIVHFNVSGKILFEKTYNTTIDFFGMLREDEVIVLNVPQNKIDIINLKTHKLTQVDHHYLFENTTYMCLYTFFESNLFCVVEREAFKGHRLRLTYYSY